MYSTVLSYYEYSQYILPRKVYVQFSLITIIANTFFPETFMYSSLYNYDYSQNLVCIRWSFLEAGNGEGIQKSPYQCRTHPFQERLCTVLSYYKYNTIHTSQERLRTCTVLSYYDYSQYILPSNVYVPVSLIAIIAKTSFPVTFMYSSLLLRL
jgi:hypothetical protein